MVVAYKTRPSTKWCLLHVKDLTTNGPFLVDTGSEFSVSPRDPKNLTAIQVETLWAVMGTDMHMYGRRSVTVDLGVSRKFLRVFTLGDVTYPVMGMDLLKNFDLLVGVRCRKMVNLQTSPTVTGSYAVINQITPKHAQPPAQIPYGELRREFSSILRHTFHSQY